MSRPAISSRLVRWGRENPSYTGQMWVTPSPESTTTPVSRPMTSYTIVLSCNHLKILEMMAFFVCQVSHLIPQIFGFLQTSGYDIIMVAMTKGEITTWKWNKMRYWQRQKLTGRCLFWWMIKKKVGHMFLVSTFTGLTKIICMGNATQRRNAKWKLPEKIEDRHNPLRHKYIQYTLSIKGQHCLNSNVHSLKLIRFKHNLNEWKNRI